MATPLKYFCVLKHRDKADTRKNTDSGLTQWLWKDREEVEVKSQPWKDIPFSPLAFFVSFALCCAQETETSLFPFFFFLFLICFPPYPSFRGTMFLLYLCFQPSIKNYITKQLLAEGSVLVKLFLFLNLGLEQVLFFSLHLCWLHDRDIGRHSVILHKRAAYKLWVTSTGLQSHLI